MSWTTKKIEKYTLYNDLLGKGSFGKVYRATLKNNPQAVFAAKCITLKTL